MARVWGGHENKGTSKWVGHLATILYHDLLLGTETCAKEGGGKI